MWKGAKLLSGVVATTMLAHPVLAADYPEKPINIVVSGAVGGSIDNMTRQLIQFWEQAIGKSFTVENKDGAGGITGVRYFLGRPDDGYNLLICTAAHAAGAIEKTAGLSTKDIDVINVQQFDPTTIVVRADSRFKTIDDLINEAKAKPNTLTWGSPSVGMAMMVGKLFARNLGLQVRFVPQDSGASSDAAILGGHVDFRLGTAAGDFAELGDKIRILAITGPKRLHFIPDVPILDELAAKHTLSQPIPYLGTGRLVVIHPSLKAKYPDRYKKLVESYKAAFHNPAYQEVLKKTGQANATQFMEPAEANKLFRSFVDDAIKYGKELGK
jgi:tripartite-type tricarboxylate transporter receptor subunit TctC